MEAHDLFGGSEYTRPDSTLGKPLKRELEEPEDKLQQDSEMAFDPRAPYSSSMDDVPLKLLFPRLKIRRRGSKKTKEMESPSKIVRDLSDSVQSKVQETLASTLEISIVEQNKKDEYTKIQRNSKVSEECSDIDPQNVERIDIKLQVGTHMDYNEERASNSLKRRQETMQKIDSIIDSISTLKEDANQNIQKDLEDTQMGCCSSIHHCHIPEEYPHKKIKVEKEESDLKLKEELIHISGQSKSIVGKVGSINKKYRERATPLVSNLKDHTDPELRTSVFSGKVTPAKICGMTEKQLASYALSGSSVNKDDELMHRFVAPSSDVNFEIIVEKVHRDEFKEDSKKVTAPSEVIDGGSHLISRSQVEEEPSGVNQIASFSEGEYSTGIMDNREIIAGCSEHTCSNSSSEQIFGVIESKTGMAEATNLVPINDDRKNLPAIISLNEYIKSKKDQSNGSSKADAVQCNKSRQGQSNECTKTVAVDMECLVREEKTNHTNLHLKVGDDLMHKPLMVDAGPDGGRKIITGCRIAENCNKLVASDGGKELRVGKPIKISPDEKLWEGCLQLNAYITVMALAFFKSGAKFQANNWSKFVEVKGRVRLDAFEKFLQELPLSRNRALMVISIRWKVGSSDAGFSGMQVIANSYKQGERVGFAELAPGVDLYVCPPDATMIHMLAKYGFIKNIENINKKQDDLIGCVVWRRNYTTSNAPLKTTEQYINAKKLALAGLLLDSPSHPGVSQWASNGNDVPEIRVPECLEMISTSGNVNNERSDKEESRLQTTQSANQIDAFEANTKTETEQNTEKDAISNLTNVHGWISHASDTGNLSPGLSQLTSSVPHNPQASTPTAFVQTTLPMAATNSNLTEKVPGEIGSDTCSIRSVKDSQNHATDEAEDDDDLPEFDFRVVSGGSQMQVTLLPSCTEVQSLPLHQFPDQLSITASPVSLTSSQCQLNGHKNTQQVAQPPTNPHPSVHTGDLKQKFSHAEAMTHIHSVENCTLKVPVPKISVTLGQQSAVSNLPHISPNSQTPYPSSNEVRKSLWDDDDDDMPEWCPPYLEQRDCLRPLVPPVAQPQSAMHKQPFLQPQLGMQNFGGNMHKVHPPPLQGPPTPRLPAPLKGLPPQALNLPQGPLPPLPQGPRPLHDIVLPIPRLVMNTDTSNSFQPQVNIKPPYCKPDFTPLRPVDGSGRRF